MKTLKLVAAIAALTGSMSASAVNIDLFTAPTGITTVSADATTTTDFIEVSDIDAPGSILGGYRDMYVKFDSATGISTDISLTTGQTPSGSGQLVLDSATGVVGTGSIQWDGNDNLATLNTMGLDEDLTGGGTADRFTFSVISADLDFNFSFALYDTDGSSIIFDLPAITTTPTGSYSSTILFSDFNNAFGALTSNCTSTGSVAGLINSADCVLGTTAGIDFAHISAMELILNTSGVAGATASLDMSIGGITTVPEPSSIALIGLGLMATGFASRRKSNKA